MGVTTVGGMLALDEAGRVAAYEQLVKDVNEPDAMRALGERQSFRRIAVGVRYNERKRERERCARNMCGAINVGSGDKVLCLACALRLRESVRARVGAGA